MTKIAKIIDAGRSLEKSKTGFTVPELMSTLNWDAKEKQYVQNIMFALTKRGQAYKLTNTRPVVYSLKPHGAATIQKPQNPKQQVPKAAKQDRQPLRNTAQAPPTPVPEKAEQALSKAPVISYEDLSNLQIPLELIGEGVFRRNRELERKIYELDTELVEMKRKLDDANKRISEQTRMIEKQNQLISGQNMDRKPTVKLKNVSSVTWKRRS